MPQSERPSSPEEHNSDQYNMYRLEHDLYELFEEQQMLLDIVTQQQERLERQLEVQRLLMSEPPARIATPLPELVLEEISAELPVMELPEPEAQSEPDHLDIVEEEVQHLVEQPPALPRSRCICTLPRRPHQVSTSLIQSMAGAKCTPPMLTGLGYDTPFSYPKRMSKGRNRRALFIFSVVDNLVLQLQHGMRLTNNNVCFSLPQRSSVVIREMPKEATTTTSTSAATSTFTSMVPKSKSKPTGALPKPKLKRFEGSTKLKATTAKRLRSTT